MTDRHADLLACLDDYQPPLVGQGLVRAGLVAEAVIEGRRARVRLQLPIPVAGLKAAWTADLRRLLKDALQLDADIEIGAQIAAAPLAAALKPLPSVRNILAVSSGKGGVGKSTVSVNLALALLAEGARVGLLDADIYGPSQPRMLGSTARPSSPDGKLMHPVMAHGLQSMSIGYLIDEEQPMIWRGPMVSQALTQLIGETRWDDLDYLVIDLPPGTGDIQLTLSQKIPVSGAIIVTTPQDIALLDARKALRMFQKVSVPVLGVVENMSTHVCSACGHEEAVFGHGGGARMAAEYGIELLGDLPLDIRIREQADSGCPTVAADAESTLALRYREIARRAVARLAFGAAARPSFPTITQSDD